MPIPQPLLKGTQHDYQIGHLVDMPPPGPAVPAERRLLNLNLPHNTPIRVEMYAMSGVQVGASQEGQFQEGQFSLDLAAFAPGQYLVKDGQACSFRLPCACGGDEENVLSC